MIIARVMPSSHLILWHPLLLPSIFPSIRDFSSESAVHIRWPKYWSLSFRICPSNEYSGLISLKINWFDIFAIQGVWSPCWFDLPADSQESSPAPQASKAWILWCSALFTVQISQLYMSTGETIAWTIWIFVSKVTSLLFKTMSRFVIAFLPSSNCLLISWLQSPCTVILETKKRKSVTASTFSPSICTEVMGQLPRS